MLCSRRRCRCRCCCCCCRCCCYSYYCCFHSPYVVAATVKASLCERFLPRFVFTMHLRLRDGCICFRPLFQNRGLCKFITSSNSPRHRCLHDRFYQRDTVLHRVADKLDTNSMCKPVFTVAVIIIVVITLVTVSFLCFMCYYCCLLLLLLLPFILIFLMHTIVSPAQ